MNIIDAIETRTSTRAFLDQAVKRSIIEEILQTARWAPSGTNTQPWDVAILSGDAKQKMCQSILLAYQERIPANPDYHYYPSQWKEPFKSRRHQCGMALYGALNIKREDKQQRKRMWELNYMAFNAPVMLLFFIDASLEKGSWLDYGMFIENVMLAALEFGLSSCAQAALAEYPGIVRASLPDSYADKTLIAGLALGYPDKMAVINSYRTAREPIENFCAWFD